MASVFLVSYFKVQAVSKRQRSVFLGAGQMEERISHILVYLNLAYKRLVLHSVLEQHPSFLGFRVPCHYGRSWVNPPPSIGYHKVLL